MSDCHRRVESFLAALLRVAHESGEVLTGEYRHAMEAGLRYFREAAPLHTLDEEDSLFPRLRQTAVGQQVLGQVQRLQDDHAVAETLHDQVELLGQEWLREGTLAPARRQELAACLQRLDEIYRDHIDLEDEVLFPTAARVLDAEQLAAIGQEMAQRRGLGPQGAEGG